MEVVKGELCIHGNPCLQREFKASKGAMGHSKQKISKQARKKEKNVYMIGWNIKLTVKTDEL